MIICITFILAVRDVIYNMAARNSTPDSAPDTELTTQKDTLMEIGNVARLLSADFIRYKLKNTSRPPNRYAETLRRVGNEVEKRYESSLNGLVKRLRFDPENGGEEAFNESLNAIFEEGPCNWGRVVMVYVFAAHLAKYCEDEHKPEYVNDLISITGKFVDERLTPWIQKQGGWVSIHVLHKKKVTYI